MYLNKKFEISIIGVGNVGFRYLQAILDIKLVEKINLFEKEFSLLKKRIANIKTNSKEIYLNNSLNKKLLNSDLIIISTRSFERYQICKQLKDMGYYGDLILEKFLFPDVKTLDLAESLYNHYPSNIYVNLWMRKTNLTKILNMEKPLEIQIESDNLGLLCNAVHFIDFISHNYKLKNLEIDLESSFINRISKAKRDGYSEIQGKLVWRDNSKKIKFSLEDKITGSNRDIYFNVLNKKFKNRFIYFDTTLKNIDSNKVDFIPYLSEHAKDSIFLILNGENPNIPNFRDSIIHHKLVFNSLSKILSKEEFNQIKIT